MRIAQRISGLLAGVFGLVALALVLTQRVEQVHTGWTTYAPLVLSSQVQSWQIVLFGSLACVVVGAACAMFAGWRDGQHAMGWPLALVGAVLSIVGIWLASANSLWLELGVPAGGGGPVVGTTQWSLGMFYFPVALFAVLTTILVVIRHAPRPARA